MEIKTVREIVEQLLSDKGEIKNSLIAKLTTQRGIPGLTKAMKIEKKVSEQGLPYLTMDKPFPDGNGRTARAITNMFLAKKGECAVFDKRTKGDYRSFIEMINSEDVSKYKQALSGDVAICDQIEDRIVYKLEEYLGIELLGEKDLYKDRDITAPLPIQKEVDDKEK